jgi:ABC-type oligopeptide transport system substrate-binding subunit
MATTPKPRAKKAAADPAPAAPAGTNQLVISDPKLVKLVADYAKAAAEKNRLEKLLKDAKPVLLQAMGDAPVAYAGKHVLTRTEVAATPDTPGAKITRSMVGQHMPGKKGRPAYTMLEVR